MKRRGMWLASLVAGLVLALVCLSGCSFVGEPNSVEDLLVRYAANPNNTNCTCEGTADIGLAVSGYRTSVPVTFQAQVADKAAHGDLVVDLSGIGMEQRDYEFYVEMQGDNSVRAYLKNTSDEDAVWERVEADASFSINIPMVVDLLSDSKFMRVAYDSDDQIRYELTLPAPTLVETLFNMGDISTSFAKLDEQALCDALEGSNLHVCFNEDCLVRSVFMDTSFTYEDKGVTPMSVKLNTRGQVVADGYGTVDPDEVKVPSDVREQSRLMDVTAEVSESANSLMSAAK